MKPDPYSDIVVGLESAYCLVLAEGADSGRSCSSGEEFFSRGPINTIASNRSGEASNVVAGAAADGIVRVVAFGADGQQVGVPLRENLFAVRLATSQFPVRVVGYDRRGRIAGIQTVRFLALMPPPAEALHNLRAVRRVTGPNGAKATLRVGAIVRKARCWRVDFTGGRSRSGCMWTTERPSPLTVDLAQPVGDDVFVIGQASPPVERVRLRFADRSSVSTRPTHGLFVLAIPRAHLSTQRQLAFALGLRDDGSVQQRQGVLFKLPR